MAPVHDYIAQMTRISHLPWNKPSSVPFFKSGNNHTSYTIVMHPCLVKDYLKVKVYRFKEHDVIEGLSLMFGSSFDVFYFCSVTFVTSASYFATNSYVARSTKYFFLPN